MKQIFLLGMLAGLSVGLYSCERAHEPDLAPTQETSAKPDTPQPEAPTSSTEGHRETPSAPRAADSIALESLGLRPLNISDALLPLVPDAPTRQNPNSISPEADSNDPANPPLGMDSSPNKIPRIFWGYCVPKEFFVSKSSIGVNAVSVSFFPNFKFWEWGFRKPYEDRPGVFDSLQRLHRDLDVLAEDYYRRPSPYDLRHMRIGHEGVDISPLFALRYADYKPVVETRRRADWVFRHVRVSDVGMNELDWLVEGYLRLLPLTDRYSRFTLYFILRDGTVISKEVDMEQLPEEQPS